MTAGDMGFEAVKLLAQGSFALFVAWQAVQWALERYKAEKHWERKLGAFSDVISALGILMNVLGEWEEQEMSGRGPRGTTEDDLRSSYWSARRQLEEAQSLALLLLSPPVADRIGKLVRGLARLDESDHGSFFDRIDAEYGLVRDARDELVIVGRRELGLDGQGRDLKNASKSSSNA